jgi:hypothetical protein
MEERIARVLDQLFAAPREDFVAVRKKLVTELRARGQKEDAKIVGATQKPTATAWAINHVATHHAEALAKFLKATTRLRDAQTEALRGGDAQAFRAANRELTARIAEIVELAKRALAESGGEPSVAQLRRISQSLHATPFASAEEIARLARGHLEKDLEAPSDFGVFAGAVPERTIAEGPPKREAKAAAELEAKLASKREAEAREAKERKEEAKERKEKEEREARERRRALIKEARAEALELEKLAQVAEKRAAEARRAADAAAAHVSELEASDY